jgi:hypothetical protein
VKYAQKRPMIGLTTRPPQLETPFSVFDESTITPNDARSLCGTTWRIFHSMSMPIHLPSRSGAASKSVCTENPIRAC